MSPPRAKLVDRLFTLAGKAVEMRAALRKATEELASAEKTGARVAEASRPVIAGAIRELEREAGKLGPFARWILEGDEMSRLREQLAAIDRAAEQAKRGPAVAVSVKVG